MSPADWGLCLTTNVRSWSSTTVSYMCWFSYTIATTATFSRSCPRSPYTSVTVTTKEKISRWPATFAQPQKEFPLCLTVPDKDGSVMKRMDFARSLDPWLFFTNKGVIHNFIFGLAHFPFFARSFLLSSVLATIELNFIFFTFAFGWIIHWSYYHRMSKQQS